MDWERFVAVVAAPVIGGLIFFTYRAHAKAAEVQQKLDAYKVEVAEKYATIAYLKDVEDRIVDHLRAIEKKLDRWIEQRVDGR